MKEDFPEEVPFGLGFEGYVGTCPVEHGKGYYVQIKSQGGSDMLGEGT